MGQRGPKPTPTKLLLMRGNAKAHARHDPAVALGKPRRPATLTPEERGHWTTLVGVLDRQGLVATIDGPLLERYCVLYGLWRTAARVVHAHGATEETPRGPRLAPQVKLMLAVHSELARVEAAFGMSPSARAALGQTAHRPQAAGDPSPDKSRFFQ
jgi:P27 family predicted phage terminase small subunit